MGYWGRALGFALKTIFFCVVTTTYVADIITKIFKVLLKIVYKIMMAAAEWIPFIFAVIVANFSGLKKTVRKLCRRFRIYPKIPSPYCLDLVDDFEDLSKRLGPTDTFLTEHKCAAKLIFEKLKQKAGVFGLRIGRTRIAGSIGKGTGISHKTDDGTIRNPDLDLVVYVNDIDPPFTSILQQFRSLLEELDEVRAFKFMGISSMKFMFRTTSGRLIKVDLLVSRNHVKENANWRGYNVGEGQASIALNQLGAKQRLAFEETGQIDLRENKLFCSAFAEKTVEIINKCVNDPFNLKMVRLAKYWNARIDLKTNANEYVRGRSCMIELIALHAQKDVPARWKNKQRCPVSGFRRFLKLMSKFNKLDIDLEKSNNNDIINESIRGNIWIGPTPIIQDPVNPLNNLARGISPEAVRIFMDQAEKTLVILEKYKSSASYRSVENAIDGIFCQK